MLPPLIVILVILPLLTPMYTLLSHVEVRASEISD